MSHRDNSCAAWRNSRRCRGRRPRRPVMAVRSIHVPLGQFMRRMAQFIPDRPGGRPLQAAARDCSGKCSRRWRRGRRREAASRDGTYVTKRKRSGKMATRGQPFRLALRVTSPFNTPLRFVATADRALPARTIHRGGKCARRHLFSSRRRLLVGASPSGSPSSILHMRIS